MLRIALRLPRQFRPRLINAAVAVLALVTGASAIAQVDMDSSVSDPTLRAYLDVICAAYNTTRKELLILKQDQIRDHQLPVAFYIARKANIPPREIVKLRLSGQGYLAIARRYTLDAESFRYPCSTVTGKPYETAYAHLNAADRNVLVSDDDVVNLVNLRLLVEHYHCAPEVVMKARTESADFVQINQRLAGNAEPKP